MVKAAVQDLLSNAFRDRRGAVAVQTFLLLPIFVLVVFGGYEFLRAMSVKQALHNGTYQAVRYLSLNPIEDSPSEWEDIARLIIEQELRAEVGDRIGPIQVSVTPPPRPPDCGDRFRVSAVYRWGFSVLSNYFSVRMKENYWGSVICG